jgi:hypothetical protein
LSKVGAADEIWVPTDWHVDVFARGGISKDKLFVLPEAIDLEFFTSVQQRPLTAVPTMMSRVPSDGRKAPGRDTGDEEGEIQVAHAHRLPFFCIFLQVFRVACF